MQLNKTTVEVLKNFSAINSNLVIDEGKKLVTISPSKDIIAMFESEDEFDSEVAIFNLNEFLGVLSAFDKPELTLNPKNMLIKQGKQSVSYNYADRSVLITPPEKGIKFPVADVTFTLTDSSLAKIVKMSAILSAEDLAVIGDGKNITLKVFDKKNSACNSFEFETDTSTSETFQVNFKIEKMKILPGTYEVEICPKISRFSHSDMKLVYFVAIEADSEFA